MQFSVITPVHKINKRFLKECLSSLCEQTYNQPFQWVVVLNGEASEKNFNMFLKEFGSVPEHITISAFHVETTGNVSMLKKLGCEYAGGEVLVELDWDDILREDALARLASVYEDENIVFAYSNSAQFGDMDWQATWGVDYPYSEFWGWTHREVEYKGHKLYEMVAFPPTAHSMRRIEYAPNHVRTWRKDAYTEIGGHDTSIELGDDHDLVCRFYLKYGETAFYHIDECLYFYRKHSSNTCALRNAEVQEQTHNNYLKYIHALGERWADDHALRKLDFGGRFNSPEGYESVDLLDADVVMDLNEDWQLEDNSVGVIRAYHILEHLKNPIHFFNEAYRVLAPGGFLFVEVPSTNGQGAWADPTHISFFNELAFKYYTDENHARFIRPQYKGRFQSAGLREWWWTYPNIPVVTTELICLKGDYESYRSGGVYI